MDGRKIALIVVPFILILISVFILASYFDHKTTADVIDTTTSVYLETETAVSEESETTEPEITNTLTSTPSPNPV